MVGLGLVVLMVLTALLRSSSITCCHLSCEIRFEAPKRQRGRDREDSKDGAAKLIYNNIYLVPDMIITAIYYN
jgi:hypothetical protein